MNAPLVMVWAWRDQQPGDKFGDNVENVWHTVKLGKENTARPAPVESYSGYSYGY